jgi:hypothetical protein
VDSRSPDPRSRQRLVIERTQAAVRLSAGMARLFVESPGQVLELPNAIRERRSTEAQPRQPWWPYVAVRHVRDQVKPGMAVFEYGGGASTLWLTDLGADVTTVEHDPGWYQQLTEAAPTATILLRESQPSGTHASAKETGYFDDYVDTITQQSRDFDLVIVDGRARVACVRAAVAKVKPGGLLILDDAEQPRYRAALDELADWPAFVGRGLKANCEIATTQVWTKPSWA